MNEWKKLTVNVNENAYSEWMTNTYTEWMKNTYSEWMLVPAANWLKPNLLFLCILLEADTPDELRPTSEVPRWRGSTFRSTLNMILFFIFAHVCHSQFEVFGRIISIVNMTFCKTNWRFKQRNTLFLIQIIHRYVGHATDLYLLIDVTNFNKF